MSEIRRVNTGDAPRNVYHAGDAPRTVNTGRTVKTGSISEWQREVPSATNRNSAFADQIACLESLKFSNSSAACLLLCICSCGFRTKHAFLVSVSALPLSYNV